MRPTDPPRPRERAGIRGAARDRPRFGSVLTIALLAFVPLADPVHGQRSWTPALDSPGRHSSTSESGFQETPEEPSREWWTMWSEASTEDRLLWGMWTVHLHHLDEGWSNDRAGAVIYRGFYAVTFRTTHGPRAYSVGLERSWLSASRGPIGGMIGYRTGLVYGYDGRLGWMAEKYPILPVIQPVLYTRVGPLAADLTYTWVVVSLAAGLRF